MDATQARETKVTVETSLGSRLARFFLDRRAVLVPFSLVVAILLWELVTRLGNFPAFILPSPGLVWVRWWQVVEDGSLLRNALVTLGEVLVGLTLGVGVATTLGYILAKSQSYNIKQAGT